MHVLCLGKWRVSLERKICQYQRVKVCLFQFKNGIQDSFLCMSNSHLKLSGTQLYPKFATYYILLVKWHHFQNPKFSQTPPFTSYNLQVLHICPLSFELFHPPHSFWYYFSSGFIIWHQYSYNNFLTEFHHFCSFSVYAPLPYQTDLFKKMLC